MTSMKLACLAVVAWVVTGCTAVAPNYVPSPSTVQPLAAAKVQPAKTGAFTGTKEANDTSLTLRASSMQASQGTYSKYLADAIKTELELAKLYAPNAATEITAVLLKNDMDTGLADKGAGTMQAKFTVTRDGKVRFDKVIAASTQWDTSFVGAIAIPKAQQEYPRLVQQLVANLFADPEFIAALK